MAVITYDVSSKQIEVKALMQALGYLDRWTAPDKLTYYLPNTTLWKKSADVSAVLTDIAAVATQLGVRLERALAVPHEPWAAIPGDAHE